MSLPTLRLPSPLAIASIWLLASLPCGRQVRAQIHRLEITHSEIVLDGYEFGAVGAYRKTRGVAHLALDPNDPANANIVDLGLAPRDPDTGRVISRAPFLVLHPDDPSRGSGTALLEVCNRGGMAVLRRLNRATPSVDPSRKSDFGDGLMMRRGLTVMWVGWQHDVPRGFRLDAPIARREDGAPLSGWARADWVVDQATDRLELGHSGHRAYRLVDPADPRNVLTVRDGRDAPRQVVPRSSWQVVDATAIEMDRGFAVGRIYELVYGTSEPRVVGIGFAAVRDLLTHAKQADSGCPFPIQRAIAIGISQSGRYLRHMLYQGFHVGVDGQPAVDGLMIEVAGAGRGSFNHRFGQPSRDAHRYRAFFYPTDIFPFASRTQLDTRTGLRDGLLSNADDGYLPKIFQTNSGYEYWGRAASLIHTSLDGSADVEPHPNERLYHVRSAQHFVGRWPRRAYDGNEWSSNPLDSVLVTRAMLIAMQDWVERDIPPPASTYPTIAAGTLVDIANLTWRPVAGINAPQVIHQAYRADYGPRFRTAGIVDQQPPKLGPTFTTLVPQVDIDGNELGGIATLETLAPLATYTPWSLRGSRFHPAQELRNFQGLMIPLSRTADEREARDDPRGPSLERRYTDRAGYLNVARAAANTLVERRWLLREDVEFALERAARTWDWIHN